MAKIVVNSFSGIAPRYADRLLDDNQASFVANLKPTTGDLRGFRSLLLDTQFVVASPIRRAVKLYYPNSDSFVWFLSPDVNADVVQSPLATDSFNRVYYTDSSHTFPQITTLDDLAGGIPSSDLGVQRPVNPPGVTHTGGTGLTDIRAYVYVYVDKYGSESAPSPPTIATGHVDDTWVINVGGVPAGIIHVDIYRSATGEQTSGNYFKVGRIDSPFNPFTDTMAASLVPLQAALDSTDNNPAPANMKGLTQHSSGALVGFYGRTVHFSRPYLPHAWPDANRYVLSAEVVGIAAISNAIIALTKAFPVNLSGTTPDAIQIVQFTDPEPCTSKRSIVVMNRAVIFASPNGLVSISTAGLDRPINKLMTNTEWEKYHPETLVSAVYGPYYIGFFSESQGFAVALPPYENVSFVPLDRYSAVTGLDTDRRSTDMLVSQTNRVSKFDKTQDKRFATTFRSREFIMSYPVNFGAFQILFKDEGLDDTGKAILDAATAYNAARFAEGPLDTIGDYALGGSLDMDFEALNPILGGLPPIQPLGGEPLYDVGAVGGNTNVRFILQADDKIVYNKFVLDETVHKLPSGYKATRYYLQVSGALPIQRIVMAQTGMECNQA